MTYIIKIIYPNGDKSFILYINNLCAKATILLRAYNGQLTAPARVLGKHTHTIKFARRKTIHTVRIIIIIKKRLYFASLRLTVADAHTKHNTLAIIIYFILLFLCFFFVISLAISLLCDPRASVRVCAKQYDARNNLTPEQNKKKRLPKRRMHGEKRDRDIVCVFFFIRHLSFCCASVNADGGRQERERERVTQNCNLNNSIVARSLPRERVIICLFVRGTKTIDNASTFGTHTRAYFYMYMCVYVDDFTINRAQLRVTTCGVVYIRERETNYITR